MEINFEKYESTKYIQFVEPQLSSQEVYITSLEIIRDLNLSEKMSRVGLLFKQFRASA